MAVGLLAYVVSLKVDSRERKDVVDDGRYSEAVDDADRTDRDAGGAGLNAFGFLERFLFKMATKCGAVLERLSRRDVEVGLRRCNKWLGIGR